MKPINVLVIDDDKIAVERAMRHLKRHDENGILAECLVDDSIMSLTEIEAYCPSTYDVSFDVVLIDYQFIGHHFTGNLVSAWMTLQLGIPRIALTTATYNGPRSYFDDFIRKDEINDNPANVIDKILSCVENFNYMKWLDSQYENLAKQYIQLIVKSEEDLLSPNELMFLEKIELILDKYEKIIDFKHEDRIKLKMEYLKSKDTFISIENDHEEKMLKLQNKLSTMITELERSINE